MTTMISIKSGGFSLIEMMVVLVIIGVLYLLIAPVTQSSTDAANFSKNTQALADAIESARIYALGRNTYVYLGISEVGAGGQSTNPLGRIVLASVASQDGTRPFSSAGNLSSSNVIQIGKAAYCDALHITSAASLLNGNMTNRPGRSGSALNVVDLSAAASTVSFSWPLTGTPKYIFTNVVEFDPQGVARIQSNGTISTCVPDFVELPLSPLVEGQAVSSLNQGAIQINALSGAIRVFRP